MSWPPFFTTLTIALTAALSAACAASSPETRVGAPQRQESGAEAPLTKSVLERLFRADEPRQEWFSPTFLDAVPLERVMALLQQVRGELGGFRSVAGSGEDYMASFARGQVQTHAKVDARGRFTGLFLERTQRAP